MSYQKESYGIMDQCYFVSKSQILTWINELLKLGLTKIEQLGAGSVYCQIVDAIHPGVIPMSRVNWKAKHDYEFIANLKLLQNAFDKIGIKRNLDVEKLARAKSQDNLQFIQWLKKYYDLHCGDKSKVYPAEDKRGCIPDFSFAEKNVIPKVFNASGLIKQNSKENQHDQTQKRERVRSPNSNYMQNRLQNNRVQSKAANQLITSGKTVNNEKSKASQSKKAGSQVEEYRKCIRDYEVKIQMITEITLSDDNADMKLKLIEEVLNINQKSNKKKQLKSPQQAPSLHQPTQLTTAFFSQKQEVKSIHQGSQQQIDAF